MLRKATVGALLLFLGCTFSYAQSGLYQQHQFLGGPVGAGQGYATPRLLDATDLPNVPVIGGGTGATTAPGARTNLGLAIGSNVEDWDSDLDCIAALSTTGLIRRTGTGTCSAGTVAITDLATGTQDTVIGYFGSTAASALAINNCSTALTYNTSTHVFGCNVGVGTGTVTEQKNTAGYGLTLSGNCDNTNTNAASPCNAVVALTKLSNYLGADVALSNTGTFFAGPTVAQGSTGVFFADGCVTVADSAASPSFITPKLWDGTNVVSTNPTHLPSSGTSVSLCVSGIFTNPPGNIRIDVNDATTTTGKIIFNSSGLSKDSYVNVIRLQ